MGLPITTVEDFKGGRYKVPLNQITLKDFTPYIGDNEKRALNYLLGVELAGLFLADLDATTNLPTSQRFTYIYDYFLDSEECCKEKSESLGIKKYLQGLIWFDYIRFNNTQNGMVGGQSNISENSEPAPLKKTRAVKLYNDSIGTLKAIQNYICENSDIYPEYDGTNREFLTII